VDGADGSYASLDLDGNGYPYISYYFCGSSPFAAECHARDLQYAYRDAFGWHIQTVDGAGDVGLYTSLALDGDGYPHISYYGKTDGDLKYAYYRLLPYHIYLPIMLKG
jgi:hypothetical protein